MAQRRILLPWDSQPQEAVDVKPEHARGYTYHGAIGTFVQRAVAPGGNPGVPNTASPSGLGSYFRTTNYQTLAIPSVTVGTGDFTIAAVYFLPIDETHPYGYILGSNTDMMSFANTHTSYGNNALFYDGAVNTFGRPASSAGEHRVVIRRVNGVLYQYIDGIFTGSAANTTSHPATTTLSINAFDTGGGNGSDHCTTPLVHWDFTRGWSATEAWEFLTNPNDTIFAPQSIWVPVSAGGAPPAFTALNRRSLGARVGSRSTY